MKTVAIVEYHCKPGMRDAFYNALIEKKIPDAVRVEPGCERYHYSVDIDDADLLHLSEIWASDEAVEMHKNTETMKVLGGIKGEFVESTDIKMFKTVD